MGEDLKTLARLQLTEDRIAEASKARDSLVEQVEAKRRPSKDSPGSATRSKTASTPSSVSGVRSKRASTPRRRS